MTENGNSFYDTRLFYSKTGRAKYISHLDVMRTMQRAFKRSGVPVWYTQGFHPHLYLTFALPLSLGYESESESVDFRLLEPMDHGLVAEKLRGALPPGFAVKEVAAPVRSVEEIAWADYEVAFTLRDGREELCESWAAFFARPEIVVKKRSKKGEREIDIRPFLHFSPLEREGERYALTMRLPAGTKQTINPSLPLEAFAAHAGCDYDEISVLRRAVLDRDLQNFR